MRSATHTPTTTANIAMNTLSQSHQQKHCGRGHGGNGSHGKQSHHSSSSSSSGRRIVVVVVVTSGIGRTTITITTATLPSLPLFKVNTMVDRVTNKRIHHPKQQQLQQHKPARLFVCVFVFLSKKSVFGFGRASEGKQSTG